MSNFDELFEALNARKSVKTDYKETIQEAIEILTKATRSLKNLDGDKFEGHVSVAETKNEAGVTRDIKIVVDGEPILAIWYASDGTGIDLNPQDSDSDPVQLTPEDAAKFSEAFKGLIAAAKANDETSSNKKLEDLYAKITNLKTATTEEEELWSKELIKCVNTIKDLEGPKWKAVQAFWEQDLTMVADGGSLRIAFAKTLDGRWKLSYNANDEINDFKIVSDHFGDLISKVDEFVRNNTENMFSGYKPIAEAIRRIIGNIPTDLRGDLLRNLLRK